MKLCLAFGILLFLVNAYAQEIIERSQELSDRVRVTWTIDLVKESAIFIVTAQTRGFIGFGLSPQGGMNQADVIIGGVLDNGEPYFTDRWATGKMEPKIDDQQDWFLLEAFENATHTVLHINRSLNTCDQMEDLPITEDTTKFIWSLGLTDEIKYHENNRGVSSVLILDPSSPVVDTSMYDLWNITVNTTIPTADTSYWCTMHLSPKAYISKRHIVGFQVNLDSELAMTHNHHLVVHKCKASVGSQAYEFMLSQLGKPGGDCYDNDGSGMMDLQSICENYYYVWAKGGTPLFLPENVGIPLNEEGTEEFFMLEIHYDNPNVLAGVTYETGVSIFTTETLREHDGGILIISHAANVALVIPPESEDYIVAGHCSPYCTDKGIPPDGFTIFNVLLHSHLSGRQIKYRQFRPNQGTGQMEELPWIFDNNYDFNYQQNRPLREYRKILPGDHLTVECTYNSTWRNPPSVTLGGLSTRHEMCETFFMYYPLNRDLAACGSLADLQKMLGKFGMEEIDWTDYNDPIIYKPEEMAGKNYSTVLNTMIEWTREFRQELETLTHYGDHIVGCYGALNYTDVLYTNYPTDYVQYQPPTKSC